MYAPFSRGTRVPKFLLKDTSLTGGERTGIRAINPRPLGRVVCGPWCSISSHEKGFIAELLRYRGITQTKLFVLLSQLLAIN